MPGNTLIELRNVTVRRDGHTLLDDVSFVAHEGEILGFVFAHGAGKSTLLRVAAGFFKPDEGEVFYRGKDVNALDFEEQMAFQAKTGFVFQNGGLLVNTKIYDNIALPLRYHTDLSEAEIEQKVTAALTQVGMAQYANRFPYELSVARQKLATLARSLVRGPEIVLYDNFITGTDTAAWQTLNRVVRQLRARGTAWMLVMEPDPTNYPIADRLCVIEDGRVIDVSEPKTMRESKDIRISKIFNTLDFSEFDKTDTGESRP